MSEASLHPRRAPADKYRSYNSTAADLRPPQSRERGYVSSPRSIGPPRAGLKLGLLALSASVHVDFHADRHFGDLGGAPSAGVHVDLHADADFRNLWGLPSHSQSSA